MSSWGLLRPALSLGARVAPRVETTTPAGALLTAVAVYYGLRRRGDTPG